MSETPKQGSILKDFDNWWFGKGSPTSLGLFRIFIGTLAFLNFIIISFDWSTWYSEKGLVPNYIGQTYEGWNKLFFMPDQQGYYLWRFNVLHGVTDDRLALAFFAFATALAFMTAIGLWTRFSSIGLAICIVSLQHRNEAILHGGDSVVRLMCIYLAVSPCGRACSVDRLIRVWKGIETGAAIQVSLWGQRLIQYNMALIYFTTTWLKRTGVLWLNGTATYFPANLNEFKRFPYPDFINSAWMVKASSWGTLVVEFSLATLVFYKPCRKYALSAGILMHFWIEYSMNIPLFSYLMVSMYITFYDGEEVAAWAKRLGARLKGFQTTVWLPKNARLVPEKAVFFDVVDPLKVVTYQAGESAELENHEVKKSWRHSLGAWPWGWWPGVWRKMMTQSLETVAEVPVKKSKVKV